MWRTSLSDADFARSKLCWLLRASDGRAFLNLEPGKGRVGRVADDTPGRNLCYAPAELSAA
jgi:hypothetical protein